MIALVLTAAGKVCTFDRRKRQDSGLILVIERFDKDPVLVVDERNTCDHIAFEHLMLSLRSDLFVNAQLVSGGAFQVARGTPVINFTAPGFQRIPTDLWNTIEFLLKGE